MSVCRDEILQKEEHAQWASDQDFLKGLQAKWYDARFGKSDERWWDGVYGRVYAMNP